MRPVGPSLPRRLGIPGRTVPRLPAWLLLLAALFVALPPAAAGGSSSARFVLEPQAPAIGAGTATSGRFAHESIAGQPGTVGTSSSPRFVLQSGLWGFAGSGLVPVFLTAARDGFDPERVDLQWSGNNPPYSVYQSTDCTAVHDSFFASTQDNFYEDILPPFATLVCYSVLATAPGPEPPPPGAR